MLFGRLRDDPPHAEATARYAFLHEGILRGYLSKIGQHAHDAPIYWKYGCWFYEKKTRSQVLIESQWEDAESEFGTGSIRLRAWGENAESLIDPLLETLQSLPVSQPPEIKRTKAIALHGTVRASASIKARLVSASPVEDLIFARGPILKDFFISYTKADQAWAKWIAWTLEEAGYLVVIQAWDFRPGANFILEMQQAATEANQTIAVLSQKYLESTFTQPEWAAAFAQDPQGKKQKLIPIRVAPCELTGILAPIVYLDLVGLPENDARAALLGAFVKQNKPSSVPALFGATMLHAPGATTQSAYPGTTNVTSEPLAESLLSKATESGSQDAHEARLSAIQRLQFMQQLNDLIPQQFNMLVFAVSPPPGLIPPMPAPQGDRATALLSWAEGPAGCGVSVLKNLLETILAPPVGQPRLLESHRRLLTSLEFTLDRPFSEFDEVQFKAALKRAGIDASQIRIVPNSKVENES